MDTTLKIDSAAGPDSLLLDRAKGSRETGSDFAANLKQAIDAVDELQHESESIQVAYARNEDVELHDVLIKIEEAEVAFKTMMQIRNKLVDAYREVMRMGS